MNNNVQYTPYGKIEWLEDGGQPEEQYDMSFIDPRKMVYPPIPKLKNVLQLAPPLRDAGFTLRPVNRGDEPWLMNLYMASRWNEVQPLVDWTEAQKISFLEMQHGMQHMNYLKTYPDGDFAIVEHEGQPLARLYLDRRPTRIQLCDIMVAPVAQGQGLGSWLIRSLQEEALSQGKDITLNVDRKNPAARLYYSLGFREISATDVHIQMVWKPVPLAPVEIKTETQKETIQ